MTREPDCSVIIFLENEPQGQLERRAMYLFEQAGEYLAPFWRDGQLASASPDFDIVVLIRPPTHDREGYYVVLDRRKALEFFEDSFFRDSAGLLSIPAWEMEPKQTPKSSVWLVVALAECVGGPEHVITSRLHQEFLTKGGQA